VTSGAEPAPTPRWFELGILAAAISLCATGLVGLALALLGRFRPWPALVVGIAVGLTGTVWADRRRGPVAVDRSAHAAAGAAVVVALVFTVLATWAPSHHVLINRDPGSYTATARWLERDGTLEAEAATGGLHDEDLLRVDGFAVYDVGGGDVQFQFTHLTAVVLAVADAVGGAGLMFRVPGLLGGLGLLAVYAVAARTTRRPWCALLAPALLGACLPMLYVARDTFSEPLALALVWSAVLVGAVAAERDDAVWWSLGGLLLGGAIATRTDVALVAAGLAPVLVIHVSSAADRATRGVRARGLVAAAAGTSVGVLAATVDLVWFSGEYVDLHGGDVATLVALAGLSLVVSVVAAAVWQRSARLRAAVERRRPTLAALGAAVVALAWLFAWWVRPHVQAARGPDEVPLVAALQRAAGVAVDASRRYGELSMTWLGWYLGALGLLLALAGTTWAVWSVLRGRARGEVAAVAAMGLAVGIVIVWRPVITPDQVWATRRFVPVVLPAMVVMGSLALAAGAATTFGSSRARRSVVAAVGVLAVIGAAVTTWPVRELREQHGTLAVLESACALAGTDASVVVLGAPESDTLAQPMRSWCGVPVAVAREGVSAADLGPVRAAVEAEGRTLVLVSSDAAALGVAADDPSVQRTAAVLDERRPERTLLRPPSRYGDGDVGWSLAVRRVAE
jgi:4-amino-4-deoxy-L-arabinose transferase-like glycosyltransferase